KIPALDWVTLTTRYSAGYEWKRAAFGQDSLGNVIQNSRNVSLNGQLNFTNLYNKVPYLKELNQKLSGGGRSNRRGVASDKLKDKVKAGKSEDKDSTAKDKK